MKRSIIPILTVPLGLVVLFGHTEPGERLPSGFFALLLTGSVLITCVGSLALLFWREKQQLKNQLTIQQEQLRFNLRRAEKNNDMELAGSFLERILSNNDLVVKVERRDSSQSRVVPLDFNKRARG
jgi:hypothetical protein